MTENNQKLYDNYDKFYIKDGGELSNEFARQARNYQKKFGPVIDNCQKNSALDIGCASGMLAAWLKTKGFTDVAGVDLNERLIEIAAQNVEGKFVAGDAGVYLRNCNKKFDVIFMLNIVEHIERTELCDFMKLIAGALASDGFVIVRCPNMSNLAAAGHLADDLTHCTGLTEQSLTQLADIAGFAGVQMLNQFQMQNFKGKCKAVLNKIIHKIIWSLRGGTKPKVHYRNLYTRLTI